MICRFFGDPPGRKGLFLFKTNKFSMIFNPTSYYCSKKESRHLSPTANQIAALSAEYVYGVVYKLLGFLYKVSSKKSSNYNMNNLKRVLHTVIPL